MEKERPIDPGSSPRSDTFGPAVVGEKASPIHNSRSASVDVAEKKRTKKAAIQPRDGGFRKGNSGDVSWGRGG